MEIVKGAGDFRREFKGLVSRVLGPEMVYSTYWGSDGPIGVHDKIIWKLDLRKKVRLLGLLPMYLTVAGKALEIKANSQYEFPYQPEIFGSVDSPDIFGEPGYKPIKILVNHPDAMEKAMLFAKEYESLSKQSATIHKNF